jgi:Fic family protein
VIKKVITLPLSVDLETKVLLKQLALAHRRLGELKGVSKTIPNQTILINTLPLLEAKDSSAIENIITTHDEVFREGLFESYVQNANAKEVQNYSLALRFGYEKIKTKGVLSNNLILEIQSQIEANRAGYRKLPGTQLKNDQTGEVVYTPPQNENEIIQLMSNLEKFINDDTISDLDPLVKMAIIHHQFESIHPFYDGNGRTGRIINILYMVHKGLLDIPVLYLSHYIIKNKMEYYRLLQDVREMENWEDWIIFLLKGVEETALQTIELVENIHELMKQFKIKIRNNFKFYSQELLNTLFYHPYTKIEFLEKDLKLSRQTASKYLEELSGEGLLQKEKIGKSNFYINQSLFELLRNR